MFIDCAKRISAGETTLIGWVIVIALTHVIGALGLILSARPCGDRAKRPRRQERPGRLPRS
jgi:hypothetical protein